MLANLPVGLLGGEAGKTLAITALSVTLAILTGLANFRKFGDLWLAFRTTEELLKKELFLFRTQSGPYEENGKAFQKFVKTTESIISVEHERFRSLIESAQRPTTDSAASGGSA